jgi:hypothetical protein
VAIIAPEIVRPKATAENARASADEELKNELLRCKAGALNMILFPNSLQSFPKILATLVWPTKNAIDKICFE